MQMTPRRMRRAVVATAIASAAVLLPAVALASSGGAAAPAAAAAHRCYAGDLTVWLGTPGNGAAGSTYYDLEISNTSKATCTVYGYAGASATSGSKQLGSAAGRDHSHPSTLVTLSPGGTAYALLQITDVGNYSPSACKPTSADALRVYPPGDFTSLTMPFQGSFQACSRRGPVYLHVTAMIAGTGIPGYSG